MLDLILQETVLSGNKKKMQNMSHIKRTRITDWPPPTLGSIKAVCGVIINMSLIFHA
jgi:hypothetical protein